MKSKEETMSQLIPVVKRLPKYGKVIYALYKKPELKISQRVLLGSGLAYVISPVDLIPGFIPVVGQLDDILVSLYSLSKVLKQLPEKDRQTLLSQYDLSFEQLNEDISLANKVSRQLTFKGLKYMGKGFWWLSKTATKVVGVGSKKVFTHILKK